MKKQWLIRKNHRRCLEYHCEGYDKLKAKVKVTIDQTSGMIQRHCGVCGMDSHTQAERYWQKRACEGCQYVRRVTVHVSLIQTGLSTFAPNGEEWAKKYCTVCDLLTSAASHRRSAAKMEAKAAKLQAKRRPQHRLRAVGVLRTSPSDS